MRMGAMQNIEKGRVGLVGCLEWFLRGIMILRGAALAAGLSRHILVSISGPACCASASTLLSAWTIDIGSSRIKIMVILFMFVF